MRNRRQQQNRGAIAATISAHPRESVAITLAGAATLTIFINALFLQHGPHPAPIFAVHHASTPAKSDRLPVQKMRAPESVPAASPRVIPIVAQPKAAAAQPAAHDDKIAELIAASSKRVMAVQQALAEFGYGQIKPTGVYGPETRTAIEQFEKSHHMPVTGKISDRLAHALATMTGRTLE